MVTYNHNDSIDYHLFYEGNFLSSLELPIIFHTTQRQLKKLQSAVLINSSGPILINEKLKEVFELYVNDIQFFNTELICRNQQVQGFYAINVLRKKSCIDIEKSEFRIMNFDKENPQYLFYFMKLKDDIFSEENKKDIIICKEMPRYLVVSEYIKNIIHDSGIRGIKFSESIDITPQNRSVYEII